MKDKIIIEQVKDIESCKICNSMLSELVAYEMDFDESINPRPLIENYYEKTLNRDDSVIFIAKQGKEHAGYIMAYKQESNSKVKGNFVSILHLYIKDNYRRLGIGRQLIEHVETWAKERFETCFLELDCFAKNIAGLDFYSKMEFEKVRYKLRKKI